MTKIWENKFDEITISLHHYARGLYGLTITDSCEQDPKSIIIAAEKLLYLQQEIEKALKQDWEETVRAKITEVLEGNRRSPLEIFGDMGKAAQKLNERDKNEG